ncbi:MAG: T9SS type A sorting domain-containing protein [Bacteroidota bacterium]|nr:T9SS type A sorting domain-containing protein [Bacteroidota bacterium]
MKKICLLSLIFIVQQSFCQVIEFPYCCDFETGPEGENIIDYESNWEGSTQWDYSDTYARTGILSAEASINTSGDDTRNLHVVFNATNQTGIKPSFYYRSTNENIFIQVVGMIDGENWIVLKDWFTPIENSWTLVNYSDLLDLSFFENQSSCKFGIRAKMNTSTATLRLDNFRIATDQSNLWKIEASSADWGTADNWYTGLVPGSGIDVLIPSFANNYPEISSAISCNNMRIDPQASLTISTVGSITLSGDFRICSDSLGTGSFLNQGSLNMQSRGSIIFERFIEAYSGAEDGWHQISSPVNAFAVAGSDFEPAYNDDLFRWDEGSYMWMNYKDATFDFNNGEGYLIACETSETKEFSGSFVETDVTLNDVSVSTGNGWHLLGNPFPCALAWNDGNWNLSNIGGVAKIYSESAGNYVDIAAGSIIPATQGFFIQALDISNSITIPLDARTHDNMALYANDAMPLLCLKAEGGENEFFDLASICFHPDAATSFDPEFDARKISGQSTAPQLYTCISSEYLSTNTLPFPMEAKLDLYFEAGTDGEHSLAIHRLQNFEQQQRVFLEDRFGELMIDLTMDSSYFFTASVNDPADRFVLHFQQLNAEEESKPPTGFRAYYHNGMIHMKNTGGNGPLDLFLFDLGGRLVYSASDVATDNIPVRASLPAGIYLIKTSYPTHPVQKIYIH